MNDQPLPGRQDGMTAQEAAPPQPEPPEPRSLTEDLEALYEDGKTYVEAEVAFQKTRARYAGRKIRNGFAFALAALAFLHLALLGLTVGLVIALAPLVGPWLATAIVTLSMLLIGTVLGLAARKRFSHLSGHFGSSDDE